ncbi:PLP-dependent aminotransferase family protein [Parendozoicomonas haliclonae]|uniref:HTH-type transcriptional regulatory protein GabR n=1 Tax=Parendozoicomonas haliclonae TaxID=1960125 RepID=A0A1X7AFJ8_9GAMM|nr:PLP-dependent aminotransferase family protein [Parendozoicomonas haliclonae]SMA37828.1 HTH-type transcriptional regulatory protein GabR [Parendozoicomonas haliclonae]
MSVLEYRDIHIERETSGNSPSLSQQLAQALRRKIMNGQLSAGRRLSSSRALASDLSLSRNTVNSAFEQLKAEGYLDSLPGSGFFVSRRLPTGDTPPESAISHSVEEWPQLSRYGQTLQKAADKYAARDKANLPFTVGLPDLRAFPFRLWQQLYRRHSDRLVLGGYHSPQGYWPLQQALAEYLNASRGLRCRPEQIVITQGAQQALALCAQLLIEPGEAALIEEPGYRGAQRAFLSAGARLETVVMGKHGVAVDQLPETGQHRLLYCTPTHQYPLGGILPAHERLQLLQWAEQQKCWIVEDDYDSEFHYYGQPVAALAGMAEKTPVIYMGSFSKTVLPGLRLGYLVVPEHLVDAFVAAKAAGSGESPILSQAVLADFIGEGHFARHLRRSRRLYQQKWEHMRELCQQHLQGLMTPVVQSAGMHLAVSFDDQSLDDRVISQRFYQKGYGSSPLSSYYYGSEVRSGLTLGFAHTAEQEREEGIQTLAELLRSQPES